MKKFFLVLTLCIPLLFSCSDYYKLHNPHPQVVKSFNDKYPNAERVKWESEGNYMKAEFFNNHLSTEAWFEKTNGNCLLIKIELRSLDELPAQVLSAFNESEYASWIVDDIDYIERNNEEGIYIIEVKKGGLEYDLFFSTDGILIKARPDYDNDDYFNFFIPDQPYLLSDDIRTFVSNKYPGCRIIEIEREHNTIEIDIIHENRGKEVVFNLKNEWINTHYDLRKSEVSTVVLNALSGSYADYYIDDIEYYETPGGDFYIFELEKGPIEIDVRIDTAGNII